MRDFVICVECGKRRVVYSKAKLSRCQENAIQRVTEELFYVCGNCLFPGGEFQDSVLVKEGLSCTTGIETTYYSGLLEHDWTRSFNTVVCSVELIKLLID